MKRTIVSYALLMAAGAFALQWLEYQYAVRRFSNEIYIVIIALSCTALGIWLGHRLTAKPKPPFEKNQQAITALGISDREYQILLLLSDGLSNQQIADTLFVSAGPDGSVVVAGVVVG